jgi:hypothetical protein
LGAGRGGCIARVDGLKLSFVPEAKIVLFCAGVSAALVAVLLV